MINLNHLELFFFVGTCIKWPWWGYHDVQAKGTLYSVVAKNKTLRAADVMFRWLLWYFHVVGSDKVSVEGLLCSPAIFLQLKLNFRHFSLSVWIWSRMIHNLYLKINLDKLRNSIFILSIMALVATVTTHTIDIAIALLWWMVTSYCTTWSDVNA